jgi:hypothetical protein
MYRQSLTGYPLSIEEGTKGVPNDGRYYVIHNGAKVGGFRSLAQATKRYMEIKATLDLPARGDTGGLSIDEVRRLDMERMSNKALIWSPEDFARVDRKTRARPKHGGGRP